MNIQFETWKKRVRLLWDVTLWPLDRRLVFIGISVGAAAGVSAFALTRLTEAFWKVGFVHFPSAHPNWGRAAVVLLPALGGLLAGGIIQFYCPGAQGHGVASVVKTLREENCYIPGRVALAKTVATAATVGLGGSAGQEGPILQIGASVGSVLGRRLGVPPEDWKILVAAGAGGGISALFGIPLAGLFFTMEVLLRNFSNGAFPAVVIACVIGSATGRMLINEGTFLSQVSYPSGGVWDLVGFGLLALVCAMTGRLYRVAIQQSEKLFDRANSVPLWLRPALGGLGVGTLALFLPEIMGPGRATINDLLVENPVNRTGWLIFGKMVATALTLGSGGSGGALMPALLIGAAVGTVWARGLNLLPWVAVHPGVGSLVGMACVFTAAFRAPLTGMVMAFELSQDYGSLPLIMLATVITNLATRPTQDFRGSASRPTPK